MTTTIVPTAPSFVAASQIKAGKLASSSRVAISSINLANWLCVYGSCNITYLAINEAPESSVKGLLGIGHGFMYDARLTTATMSQDLFVVGKRLDAAGWHAFNQAAGGAGYDPVSGSVDEGVSITRGYHDSVGSVFATFDSYYGYMLAAMTVPNHQSTSGMIEPARSSTQPIVSAFEDDAIGHAADGGSMQGVADIIKRAWEQHVRCAFSYRQQVIFSSGDTSWTNLVDRVVGTSGYKINYKGRQLYNGDTTAYLHIYRKSEPWGVQLKISTSKDCVTLSTGLSTDSSTVLVDCLADDEITVWFKNSTGGNVRLYSLAMLEWYSSGVE